MLDIILARKLYQRLAAEGYEDDPNVASNFVFYTLGLTYASVIAYISWNCSTRMNLALPFKVAYTTLAWMCSITYGIYYMLFGCPASAGTA